MSTNSATPPLRLYERAIAAIPICMFMAFVIFLTYESRDQGFRCVIDSNGHPVPTKEAEGAVEFASGNAYLVSDKGARAWIAGPCGRNTPDCHKAYSILEAMRGKHLRVGLCGERALFIDAGGERLFEDRSTQSTYRRAPY